MFRFKVGELLKKPHGARQKHRVSENGVEFDVAFMKLKETIHVAMRHLKAAIPCECSRCLKRSDCPINVPLTEREFFIGQPEHTEEGEEVYFVDMKDSEVDLSEMVRQEISLHTPAAPLCKTSCKGLCAQCGKDLNTGACSCKKVEVKTQAQKPFRHLKNIVR